MKTPRRTTKKQKSLAVVKDSIAITQQNLVLKRFMQALLPELLVGPQEELPPAWVIRLGKKIRAAFGIQDPQATDPESQGKITAALQAVLGFLVSVDPKKLPEGFRKDKMKPFQQATQDLARGELSMATSLSGDEQSKFFEGYSEGINGTIDPSGHPAKGNTRFKLDLTLVMFWANGLHFKNLTELYVFLGRAFDTASLGDLASFQRYMRKMGVRYGTRGRQTK